jgi:hypothetical protein
MVYDTVLIGNFTGVAVVFAASVFRVVALQLTVLTTRQMGSARSLRTSVMKYQ